MRAERFGSYSIAATFAGIPVFSRRKSTDRYFCWCPPPRCHAVTSPCEFRPPVRFCTSTSDFSGVCLVISLLSSMVRKRRDGVYGLNVFIAIVASYRFPSNSLARSLARLLLPAAKFWSAQIQSLQKLNVLGVLDHLFAFFQPHVRLLPIAAETLSASPPAELAVKNCRAHVIHFHLENALHRFLDLGLGSVLRDLKHHRVLRFLHAQTLLGNDGTPENLINPVLHRLSLLPFGLGFGLRFFFRRGLLRRLFRSCSSCLHRSFRLRAFVARCFLRSSTARSRLNIHRPFRTRRRKRTAELRHRFARQHHLLVPQQIVRLQRRRRHQRHTRDITAGAFQIHIRAAFHQQVRFGLFVQLAQHLAERLRLVRIQRPAVHYR